MNPSQKSPGGRGFRHAGLAEPRSPGCWAGSERTDLRRVSARAPGSSASIPASLEPISTRSMISPVTGRLRVRSGGPQPTHGSDRRGLTAAEERPEHGRLRKNQAVRLARTKPCHGRGQVLF